MAKKTIGEAVQSCQSAINKLAETKPAMAKMFQNMLSDCVVVATIEQLETKVRSHLNK